ncbi:MAG TPA: CpsB/CapC family capsule biosynthesis tyrosine phosphatase, partial [Ktedonobacterales bacterium]|nr:CpsB/CapC family capsule biosynthesis tyrosine phosphatase [Ktedonobacterales bacterium]
LGRGAIATINDGPYILLSLPAAFDPHAVVALIRRLRRSGFAPILAHIERSTLAQYGAQNLRPFVAAGALTQVTLASLVGRYGQASQAAAYGLLRARLAHCLASGARSAQEAQWMPEGLRVAHSLVGAQRLWELTVEAPATVVAGDPIVPMLDYPPA